MKPKIKLRPGFVSHKKWRDLEIQCPSCGNKCEGKKLMAKKIEKTQDLYGYKCRKCNFYALQDAFRCISDVEL